MTINEILAPLDFDGERDAADNLLGAITDIERGNGCDRVVLDTMMRVYRQLCTVYTLYRVQQGEMPE